MAKKILVVDDKPELRTLLKSYLSQEGFEVVNCQRWAGSAVRRPA